MRGLFILILLIGLFATPALAQEEPPCINNTLAATIADIQTHLDTAQAAVAIDTRVGFDELEAIKDAVVSAQVACSGLSFQGDEATVLGPIDIPEGVYRATAKTDGFISVIPTVLDGDCGEGPRMGSSALFLLTKGQATNGAEAVFTSAGCSVLLEVSNVRLLWTLAFEKLN